MLAWTFGNDLLMFVRTQKIFEDTKNQNKLLGISLGPWLHAEAIGSIVRRLKQFLKSKTLAFDDFWDFMDRRPLLARDFMDSKGRFLVVK